MRGTIFYNGNRGEAIDSAKNFILHKQKIRAIMSRQSPIPPPILNQQQALQNSSLKIKSSLDKDTLQKISTRTPYLSPRQQKLINSGGSAQCNDAVKYQGDNSSTMKLSIFKKDQVNSPNVNNLHSAKVHRITPSKQMFLTQECNSENNNQPSFTQASINAQRNQLNSSQKSRDLNSQQSQFRISSLNYFSKKKEEQKINNENERLLKKIVEITFRRKNSQLGQVNHQELAFKPYMIKPYHNGEKMKRDLKRIYIENKGLVNKLQQIDKWQEEIDDNCKYTSSRENSPGFITHRKLEQHHETVTQLKKQITRIHRSPLNSGMRASLYFPSLRSSYQYSQVAGPLPGTAGISEFIDSSLDNISAQVKRRIDTSRSRRYYNTGFGQKEFSSAIRPMTQSIEPSTAVGESQHINQDLTDHISGFNQHNDINSRDDRNSNLQQIESHQRELFQ